MKNARFSDGEKFYDEVMALARQHDRFGHLNPDIKTVVCLTGIEIWQFSKKLCETQDVCMYRRFSDPPPPKALVEANARIQQLEDEVAALKLQLGLTTLAVIQKTAVPA